MEENDIKNEDLIPREPGGFLTEVWSVVKVVIISLVIVLPIRYYIVQPFVVRGASMEPNFEDRQYLIVDEFSYRFDQPQRGDTIVFRYPLNPQQFFIKRIIGLPGERLELHNGRIKIFSSAYPDGYTLEEPYLSPPDHPTYPDEVVTLNQNQYFVMGDNRDFSSDSRIWGPLPKNYIVGRVLFRAWPPTKFGFISYPLLSK